MGDDGGPIKKELNDSRADFMSSYVMKSMRIKADKWQKLIATDEYRVSTICSLHFANPQKNIPQGTRGNLASLRLTCLNTEKKYGS